jgi:hypothetical protein
LDVGGTKFTTTIETAVKLKHGVPNQFSDVSKSKEQVIFIDRDATHFRFILNYLRDNDIDIPEDYLSQ